MLAWNGLQAEGTGVKEAVAWFTAYGLLAEAETARVNDSSSSSNSSSPQLKRKACDMEAAFNA
jgi:hypothetical protein